jgi:hypothetical protein
VDFLPGPETNTRDYGIPQANVNNAGFANEGLTDGGRHQSNSASATPSNQKQNQPPRPNKAGQPEREKAAFNIPRRPARCGRTPATLRYFPRYALSPLSSEDAQPNTTERARRR